MLLEQECKKIATSFNFSTLKFYIVFELSTFLFSRFLFATPLGAPDSKVRDQIEVGQSYILNLKR